MGAVSREEEEKISGSWKISLFFISNSVNKVMGIDRSSALTKQKKLCSRTAALRKVGM